MLNTIKLSYNDFGLCDILAIVLNIQWHQLIPHTAHFSPCPVRRVRASTSDITTMPVICSNVIFQEDDYFENSKISSSVREQALYTFI